MVSAVPLVKQPVPKPVGEQRVVFNSLTWQGFLTMRQSLSPDRNTRLTYLEGTLEITTPLEIHEFSAWLIGRFIYILVSELGMELKTMGSTTFTQHPPRTFCGHAIRRLWSRHETIEQQSFP